MAFTAPFYKNFAAAQCITWRSHMCHTSPKIRFGIWKLGFEINVGI